MPIIEPTKEQLQARLNPIPFTIKVPTSGLFQAVGGYGDTIYKKEGDIITVFDVTEMGKQAMIEADPTRDRYGNYPVLAGQNAGTMAGKGVELLKKKYGFNVESLPKVNIADLMQSRNSSGQSLGSIPNQMLRVGDINQFLGVSPAQLKEAQLNTQAQLQGNVTPTKQVSPTGTQTKTPTGIPNFSQFGNFTRQLQFGDSGEDVKRLQQFLNASDYQVAKEGEGSPGKETEFFGPLTQAALQEFQKNQGIVSKGDPTTTGFGRFGPKTMAFVNNLTTTGTKGVGAGTSATDGGTAGATGGTLPNQPHPNDTTLDDMLKNSNIPDDQKNMIKTFYNLVSQNDQEQAQRLIAVFNTATEFSDPYFKAQASLITDALTRSLSANEGDLEFQQKQLENSLADLRADINASKDYADFQKTQELEQLARQKEVDLENLRQNLAMVGKTSSSVRSRSEQLLEEQNQGLVQSATKKFSYQTGGLERQLSSAERDTQLELAHLQDKTTQNRIADLRRVEEQIGSSALTGLGYSDILGGIGGELQRKKVSDALSFSSNFII